jgi:hypothetical protein
MQKTEAAREKHPDAKYPDALYHQAFTNPAKPVVSAAAHAAGRLNNKSRAPARALAMFTHPAMSSTIYISFLLSGCDDFRCNLTGS